MNGEEKKKKIKRSSAAIEELPRAMTAWIPATRYVTMASRLPLKQREEMGGRESKSNRVAIHLADARWDPIASGEGGSSEMRCDAMRCDAMRRLSCFV